MTLSRSRFRSLFVSSALCIAASGCAVDAAPSEAEGSAQEALRGDPMATALHRLAGSSRSAFHVSLDNGFPVALMGRFPTGATTPVAAAQTFVTSRPDLFPVGTSALDMRRTRSVGRGRYTRVTIGQRAGGVEVHGAELAVILQGTDVVGVFGRLARFDAAPDVVPAMTSAQAIAHATRIASTPSTEGTSSVGGPALEASLVHYDAGLFAPNRGSVPALAYRVLFPEATLFVDAKTGALLARNDHASEAFDIHVRSYGPDGGWHSSADEVSCLDSLYCYPQISMDALPVRNHFKQTYDYYAAQHGWISYNGGDWQIQSFVESPNPTAHYWNLIDGSTFHFQPNFDSVDIVGHEFTHGMIGNTSNLEYKRQSGALNEALADLFGNLVEGNIDGIGENSNRGQFRSLCNPPSFNWDPQGPWGPTPLPAHMSDYVDAPDNVDNGGVHANSGIPGRAFCAMTTDFGAGNPNTNAALGRMGRIAFLANDIMTSSSGFKAARGATLFAAMLETSPDPDRPMLVPCQVLEAWDDVGVYGGGLWNDVLTPLCELDMYEDPDDDFIPSSEDNCFGMSNADQKDSDSDGLGDACDDDIDNDGYSNYYDNCPFVPNLQQDADHDGVGDACDPDYVFVPPGPEETPDLDGDGIEEGDNCPFLANGDQKNSDGDSLGDACDPCPGLTLEPSGYTSGIPELDVPPQPIFEDTDGDGVPNACDEMPLTPDNIWVDGAAGKLAVDGGTHAITIAGDGTAGLELDLCGRMSCDPGLVAVLTVRGLPRGTNATVVDAGGRLLGQLAGDGSVRFTPRAGVTHRMYVHGAGSLRFSASLSRGR